MLRSLAAGTLAGLLVCSGCGGAKMAPEMAGAPLGSVIYARSCAGCHTLAGNESGAEGGDLLTTRLSVAALASFAEAMPVNPALSRIEALSVARFIHARHPRPRCPASGGVGNLDCRPARSPAE